MSRKNQAYLVSLIIWGAGAYLISVLWNYHFRIEAVDQAFGFIIYVVAFFYFITYWPIYQFISRAMPTEYVVIGPHQSYELEVVYRAGDWNGRLVRKYPAYPKPSRSKFLAKSREELLAQAESQVEHLPARLDGSHLL